MAAKGGGESKAGIVIPLVLFVLLSIILGVTTYTGYQAADLADKGKKEADTKKNEKEKEAEWFRYFALMMREYTGYSIKDEKTGDADKNVIEAIGVLRGKFASGQGSSNDSQLNQNTQLLSDLEKRLGWDDAVKRPRKTILQELADLQKQLKDTQAALASEKARADGLDRDKANLESENKKAREAFQASLVKQNKDTGDEVNKVRETVKAQQDEVDRVNKEKNDLKSSSDAEITRMKQVIDACAKLLVALRKAPSEQVFLVRQELSADFKAAENAVEKLAGVKLPVPQERIAKVDRLKDVEPKGTVYRMDRTGDLPYIDLGSAHGLKAGQTFSIHGKGPDGRALRESKGSLEVVRVLDARTSQTRITALADQGRDPVMPGDLLVNPAWSPNQKMHIALVGLMDLTGDGRDGREELVRTLSAQNVVVDAYLDLKDLKIVGQMTARTDYLVVGFAPDGNYTARKEGDGRAEKADKAASAMAAMQDQAAKDGVQIIRLKDFLALTGYRAPRSIASDGGNSGLVRPSAPGLGAPSERRDMPKLNGK